MAAKDVKGGGDFYEVLGLEKECTDAELRNAYKKLAMRWHPDRCSASGNAKYVDEAKKKFQAIQHAYSVLSDSNKRFMYDIGFYGCDDDDENGMVDFLNEMVSLMNQTDDNENVEESFEELQELFEDMFHMEAFSATSQSSSSHATGSQSPNATKQSSAEINLGEKIVEGSSSFNANYEGFCFGTGGQSKKFEESGKNRRKNARRGRK